MQEFRPVRFVYFDFLFFLTLSSFGFRRMFRKQDNKKLTIAPIDARRTVITISSALIRLREDKKVPLAVPIQIEAELVSIIFRFCFLFLYCSLAYRRGYGACNNHIRSH